MSPATLQVNVSPLYRRVAPAIQTADRGKTIAVEHASLNCRSSELLLLMAYQQAIESLIPTTSMLLTQKDMDPLLLQWMDLSSVKARRSSFGSWTRYLFPNGSTLWTLSGDYDSPIAAEKPTHFYMAQAEYFKGTYGLAGTELTVVIGEFCDRQHWFYRFAREPNVELYRLPMGDILASYPEQARAVLPRTDPTFERRMLLEDVIPDYANIDLEQFARSRIKIRSDKPKDVLSQVQREEAESQGGESNIITFELSELQKRYVRIKKETVQAGKKPWFLLLKARRIGFTTFEQIASYAFAITRPQSNIVTLAHTGPTTNRIFEDIVRLAYNNDPFKPPLMRDRGGELIFAHNMSRFYVGTAGGKGFSRGDTTQKVHGSEVAFWLDGNVEKQSALWASITGACSFGEIVFETTANGREKFCLEYEEAKAQRSLFTPIFFAWFDDPRNRKAEGTYDAAEIKDTLTADEEELILKHRLSPAQIAFRRDCWKQYRVLTPQEMPEDDVSCFLTSGLCFFQNKLAILNQIKKIQQMKAAGQIVRRPLADPFRNGQIVGFEERYEPPITDVKYVIGADTSEGVGRDPNGIRVVRQDTGKLVHVVHGQFSIKGQAHNIKRLLDEYNGALTLVERQNHGHSILEVLMSLGITRPHTRGGPLYYHKDSGGTEVQFAGKSFVDGRPGWDTGNDEVRNFMLNTFADYLETNINEFYDELTLTECLSFKLQTSGRFDHDDGAHDDGIFSNAIAQCGRRHRRGKPFVGST